MIAAQHPRRRLAHEPEGLEFQPAPEGATIRDTRTHEEFALLGWYVAPGGRRIYASAVRPGRIPVEHTEPAA
ncbi:MAG: hypothetical protein JSR72_23385 [Proteobacteria bacterium]|nr:hypothetical protein [Pseudomonadota bacterium]